MRTPAKIYHDHLDCPHVYVSNRVARAYVLRGCLCAMATLKRVSQEMNSSRVQRRLDLLTRNRTDLTNCTTCASAVRCDPPPTRPPETFGGKLVSAR
ncbi:hypothetical protein MNBD_ACTINO02-907 [hydrothermal vent metagenome]|uniref:Uncharacterized protein n=1 Tax=hydrothermal vent metagenome TaxID=652676 RepID=A0A3B0TDW6_9ZZZZ